MSSTSGRRLDAWLEAADALLAAPVITINTAEACSQRRGRPMHSLALAAAVFGEELAGESDHRLVGKLWARVGTGRGSELHVRVGWLAGTEFVQLLDFVPSTGVYTTSVMLERRLLDHLLDELVSLGAFR